MDETLREWMRTVIGSQIPMRIIEVPMRIIEDEAICLVAKARSVNAYR